MGADSPSTLIFCQTRKQCSVLYRMFEVFLGLKMFSGGVNNSKKGLLKCSMLAFLKRVKEHIIENMAKDDGHLRVVICTVAFGMDHPRQECGRAGRDGLPSSCILLFNGLLQLTVKEK